MAKSIDGIETQTPKAVTKASVKRFSIPDRGDGLSEVVEAETKAEAVSKAEAIRKKFANKTKTS